jgi:HSP20 family molecular chaperone IbpA
MWTNNELTNYIATLDRIMNESVCNLTNVNYTTSLSSDKSESIIEIEIPGAKKESIVVEIVDSKLNIVWNDRKGKKQTIQFAVGTQYDIKATTATYEDGVLTLKQPLRAKETIKVEIK